MVGCARYRRRRMVDEQLDLNEHLGVIHRRPANLVPQTLGFGPRVITAETSYRLSKPSLAN
jgi:hypothetical protein